MLRRLMLSFAACASLAMVPVADADVLGGMSSVLGTASSLIEKSGTGPGKRHLLLNGTAMVVDIRYRSGRPEAFINTLDSQLQMHGGYRLQRSAGGRDWAGLLRVPMAAPVVAAGREPVGFTLALRPDNAQQTTVWDITLADIEALTKLRSGEIDPRTVPQPEHMQGAPGATLAFDMLDQGAAWLSHTRVYTNAGPLADRVAFYTRQLESAGFDLDRDAGSDGESWLRSFSGAQGSVNLFVRTPSGRGAATDVLQFHSVR